MIQVNIRAGACSWAYDIISINKVNKAPQSGALFFSSSLNSSQIYKISLPEIVLIQNDALRVLMIQI